MIAVKFTSGWIEMDLMRMVVGLNSPEHLFVHVRVKVKLVKCSHLLQLRATLPCSKEVFFLGTKLYLERQNTDEGFLETEVWFKLGDHVLNGGSLKSGLESLPACF